MKKNLLVLTFAVLAIIVSSCASHKKYMTTVFDLIKISFPEAKTEMVNNRIKLIFPYNDMFEVGSSTLKPKFHARVEKMAEIMNKYPETNLHIIGHTDNTGKHEDNMKLSMERASNVMNSIKDHNVSADRLQASGKGETEPIADNNTDAGKAENRRVEFEIFYGK